MNTKYGYLSSSQLQSLKNNIRKSIFFLLLYVDPQTKNDYPDINIADAFQNLQYKLTGLNSILLESPELMQTMCLLEAALNELNNNSFDYRKYRKLILDAGSEIMKVKAKEGD